MSNHWYCIKKRVVYFFHPFFIIFLLNPSLLHGTPKESETHFQFTLLTKNAYADLLKLKLPSAENNIKEQLDHNPKDGIAIYLQNYADVLKLFINEDPELYKTLAPNEEVRLSRIKKLSNKSPYYLFTQAEIKLQWAFVKMKFGDDLGAVWSIRQAYKLLEENQKKYPDFTPNQKSLGLLNVLIGSIPEKYSWVASLAGMYGSINHGVAMLDKVIKEDPVYKLEARMIRLGVDYYILHSEQTSLSSIKNLKDQNQDNLLINFMYASVLLKESYNEQALEVIESIPKGNQYMALPFLHYMTGMVYLNKGEYNKARINFNIYLKEHKGKNFIKDTYYRIFLTHWLSNNDKEAEESLAKVIQNGVAIYDADKYADNFAKNRDFPHKALMEARLYTDGGYYSKAKTSLSSMVNQKISSRDKIEYYYRYARIYHKTHELERARDMYLKTIEESGALPYYFAPNSALQLGYIFKEENNIEEARNYFNLALSYKNHQYKNSIDNKAKAALSELKK
ncbi:MAG: tetratricopeptide repeat protein [Cytophagaceae bacterium]